MPFPIWPKKFQSNRGTVPAAFWNKVRRELAAALDGVHGGVIAPASVLHFAGTLAAHFYDLTITGTWTLGNQSVEQLRLKDLATNVNVTVRSALDLFDVLFVDASAHTANRTITIGVDSNTLAGEMLWVTRAKGTGGSFNSIIHSEGATTNNPVFTLAPASGEEPDWALLMFDDTETTDNANGEWIVVAMGRE